jgi:hypothetical protein
VFNSELPDRLRLHIEEKPQFPRLPLGVSANKYQSRATVEEAKEMPIPARLFGEAAARASAIEARSVAFSPKVIRVRASDALGLHKTPEGVNCSAR